MNQKRPCKVTLIYPPLIVAGYGSVYGALPILAACLARKNICVKQYDFNSAFMDWYVSSEALAEEMERRRRSLRRLACAAKRCEESHRRHEEIGRLIETYDALRASRKAGALHPEVPSIKGFLFDLLATNKTSLGYQEMVPVFCKSDADTKIIQPFYEEQLSLLKQGGAPLYIGISISMSRQLRPALQLARMIQRDLWKDVPIVLGGAVCSLLPNAVEKKLFREGVVKGVVKGEGEEAVVQIAENLKKRKPMHVDVPNLTYAEHGRLLSTGVSQLISINDNPDPVFERKDLKRFRVTVLPILVGRKCYWGRCKYCTSQKYIKRYQFQRPQRVVETMMRLSRNYRIREFLLVADCFTPRWLKEFAERLIASRYSFKWYCFMRVDTAVSHQLLKDMKRAGCAAVTVGIESLDDTVLEMYDKGYSSAAAEAFIVKLLRSRLGICLNMIVDLPGTTFSSALRQEKVLKKLVGGVPRVSLQINLFDLEKHSYIETHPNEFGIKLSRRARVYRSMNAVPWVDEKGMGEDELQEVVMKYARDFEGEHRLAAQPVLRHR